MKLYIDHNNMLDLKGCLKYVVVVECRDECESYEKPRIMFTTNDGEEAIRRAFTRWDMLHTARIVINKEVLD